MNTDSDTNPNSDFVFEIGEALHNIKFGIEFETCICSKLFKFKNQTNQADEPDYSRATPVYDDEPDYSRATPVYKYIDDEEMPIFRSIDSELESIKEISSKLQEIVDSKQINARFRYTLYPKYDKDYSNWTVTTDQSVRCDNKLLSPQCFSVGAPKDCECEPKIPVEIVSPIYEYSTNSYKIFESVIDNVFSSSEIEFESNTSQGLHMNISSPNFFSQISTLQMWWYFEPVILDLVNPSRLASKYAVRLRQFFPTIDSVEKYARLFYKEPDSPPSKYTALCMKSDRFEFRFIEASMSRDHIMAWLGFCARFVAISPMFDVSKISKVNGTFEELFEMLQNENLTLYFKKIYDTNTAIHNKLKNVLSSAISTTTKIESILDLKYYKADNFEEYIGIASSIGDETLLDYLVERCKNSPVPYSSKFKALVANDNYALKIAVKNGHLNVVRYILKYAKTPNAVQECLEMDTSDEMRKLLEVAKTICDTSVTAIFVASLQPADTFKSIYTAYTDDIDISINDYEILKIASVKHFNGDDSLFITLGTLNILPSDYNPEILDPWVALSIQVKRYIGPSIFVQVPKIQLFSPESFTFESPIMQSVTNFVAQFGQVQRKYIEKGLKRAKLIGTITINNAIISSATLKRPLKKYYLDAYAKAGAEISRPNVEVLEYGYAGTLESYRRNHYSSKLLSALLTQLCDHEVGESCPHCPIIFATVHADNTAEINLLDSNGFSQVGEEYSNETGDYSLLLFEYNNTDI